MRIYFSLLQEDSGFFQLWLHSSKSLKTFIIIMEKAKPDKMVDLYNTIVRSIFEYGSISFVNAAEVHMDKLQILQNQALRVVMKSPRYMAIKDLPQVALLEVVHQHLEAKALKEEENKACLESREALAIKA